ncbi:uncharacterized protein cubi_01226 [Cryptosporidium ubiquitum]|uniref:Uncharacterized protein n=1 Tax=Cryptosporidium ubiquitum TaxID=857276 RepID=A0A1J4MJJ8_9CRYT|nr:uncharacterized protein cubi_01226 [Cryptosporidium ubiquitum]OII74382.1 hypothetical protein cubi_01226 [Cryptosporidium ubiquitum]
MFLNVIFSKKNSSKVRLLINHEFPQFLVLQKGIIKKDANNNCKMNMDCSQNDGGYSQNQIKEFDHGQLAFN